MVSLSIEERFSHYFLAMGAQQITEKPALATLSFVIEYQTVNVIVASTNHLTQSNILTAMLDLSTLRATSNQLYLAIPRVLGASIDAQIFRAHGLGLLLYDDRRIDEVVSPQTLPITDIAAIAPNQDLLATTAQLTELKSLYLELKDNIAGLKAELTSIESRPQPMTPSIEIPQPHSLPEQHVYTSTNALPAFFTNNPWLDVLSKRGRESTERFAG